MGKKSLMTSIFIAGVSFGVYGMGNPEFSLEKDPFKFIPRGASVIVSNYTVEKKYDVSIFWYNENYKKIIDYEQNTPLPSEMFVDINTDGIPDMTLLDAKRAYKKMKEREARIETPSV